MNLLTLTAEVRNNTMCNIKNELRLTVSKTMQNKLFHLTHSCASANPSCVCLDICVVVTSTWISKENGKASELVLVPTPLVSQCSVCALTPNTGQSKYKVRQENRHLRLRCMQESSCNAGLR